MQSVWVYFKECLNTYTLTHWVILNTPKKVQKYIGKIQVLLYTINVKVVDIFWAQSFTSLKADLLQDVNRVEFLHFAGALMEHFLEGIALSRLW